MTSKPAKSSSDESKSEIDTVIELFERGTGATLPDLVEATGWQPHSVRAVLTGLKKKGKVVSREKTTRISCCHPDGREWAAS